MVLRFLELGSFLDPERPHKMDKGVILSDAVRMVTQLRKEAEKLKESNRELQEKINELKVQWFPCLSVECITYWQSSFILRFHENSCINWTSTH